MLTFDPEIGGAADTSLGIRHLPRFALTSVVSVVNDPVQFSARPLVNVEDQGGVDGFKVILCIIWLPFTIHDGVSLIILIDGHAIFEPHDLAQWRALNLDIKEN